MKYRLILAAVVILLLSGCTGRNASKDLTYTGTIEAREIDVSTQVGGTIEEIGVEEGQPVVQGDVVCRIDTESLKLQLMEAEAGFRASQAALDELNSGTRSEEVRKAEANVANIEALLEGAKKDYEYCLQNLTDMEQLFQEGAVSLQRLDETRLLADKAYSNVRSLEKQYESAKAQLDLVLNGPTGQKISMAEAEVERAQARVELLRYQLSKGKVLAPISGIVQKVFYEQGEFIPTGGVTVSIIDPDDLWVKIYVPEKHLHRIALGDEVRLYADAFEDKEVTGEVIYISTEAEFTPNNVESKESKEEMVFAVKVRVNLGEEPLALKPGMIVDVRLDGGK